jgi:membrane fusion protein (multidrug efflux system)
MHPGQPVDLRIDAYPEQKLRGRVESIQAGSGARFSLLPPENATGNYVKVVQRVPVRIVFDQPPPADVKLGPGMSVAPRVRVR